MRKEAIARICLTLAAIKKNSNVSMESVPTRNAMKIKKIAQKQFLNAAKEHVRMENALLKLALKMEKNVSKRKCNAAREHARINIARLQNATKKESIVETKLYLAANLSLAPKKARNVFPSKRSLKSVNLENVRRIYFVKKGNAAINNPMHVGKILNAANLISVN